MSTNYSYRHLRITPNIAVNLRTTGTYNLFCTAMNRSIVTCAKRRDKTLHQNTTSSLLPDGDSDAPDSNRPAPRPALRTETTASS